MRGLSILGSTGSVGTNVLRVVDDDAAARDRALERVPRPDVTLDTLLLRILKRLFNQSLKSIWSTREIARSAT